MTKAMVTINPEINMGVLVGIITGLVAGAVYNRWAGIKLPDFLSFFGGKRFVPIATRLLLSDPRGDLRLRLAAGAARYPLWRRMDRLRRGAGFRYLWFHQPSADPNRSASGAEHHRLVPDW